MTFVRARLCHAAFLTICFPHAAGAKPTGIDDPCAGPLDPARTVRCALARSPEVGRAHQELAALDGRQLVAGTLLPAHPSVSLSMSERSSPGPAGRRDLNWTATLSQELELPGKRSSRIEEADAERASVRRRIAAIERETAAATLSALYTVAAGEEALGLAADLTRGAEALASALTARAAQGLIAPLEGDLAAAEAIRLSTQALDIERRRARARAHLAALLGVSDVDQLTPPSALLVAAVDPAAASLSKSQLIERALVARADLVAVQAEQRTAAARVERLRRRQIPNLTLSVFAARDGFDERVVGGGLSIPLVLPSPLAPSGRGEIREGEARWAQVAFDAEAVRRRVREEVTCALTEYQSRRAALARFTPEILARARHHVAALADALRERQLAPREALVAQRSLIELLQGHIEARLGTALASVELERSAALPLPGVGP